MQENKQKKRFFLFWESTGEGRGRQMERGSEPRLEKDGNGRRNAEYSGAGGETEAEGVQPSQGRLNPAQDKFGWCFTPAAPSSKPCVCRAVK